MSDFYKHVTQIAAEDVTGVMSADGDANYGGSWKRRGGVGAFMMLARKWDRIERRAQQYKGDLVKAAAEDTRTEGLIDDVRDLRRYCLLVVSEVLRVDAGRQRVAVQDLGAGTVGVLVDETYRLGHLKHLGSAAGLLVDAAADLPEDAWLVIADLWASVEGLCSPVSRNRDGWRSIFDGDRLPVIRLGGALLAFEAGLRSKGVQHGSVRG